MAEQTMTPRELAKRLRNGEKWKVVPNPGSAEAIELGCTCPVIDNAHGRGSPQGTAGAPQFWIDEHCPLHAGNDA